MGAKPTIAVIGGGVGGLAAAVRLAAGPTPCQVVLLESSGRVGGLLNTVRCEGYLIEEAAESFVPDRSAGAWELCELIGFGSQLVPAKEHKHRAHIAQGGRLRPIPSGLMQMAPTRLWPFVTTRILSTWGKLRLAWEPFVPKKSDGNEESVADFARRRLGSQAYDRLVRPLVESIYGCDPARLSMSAIMPRPVDMERTYGSLFRAARSERKHRPPSGHSAPSRVQSQEFQAPRQGMSSFVAALANYLPEGTIRLNSPVERVVPRSDGQWNVVVAGGNDSPLVAEGVIVATPAAHAAGILKDVDERLAEELLRIPYAPRTQVTLGYRAEQVVRRQETLGVFLPRAACRHVRSVTMSSEKFPGRAPAGSTQMRITIGDGDSCKVEDLSDDELVEVAATEVAPLLGTMGKPQFTHVVRHRQALPQYSIGHLERLARIDNRLSANGGLALAGAAYRGIGVPQCIHGGKQAAESVLSHLERKRGAS